ncbi:MAG: hypothetical protein ACLVI5_10670, partial [Desulfovibrio piger]|uniref:hypothetical protein n=1 Tax=Desulfovibrio piger TaxID=901 RepID=UPI00399B093B
QGLVLATEWEFDSPLRHQVKAKAGSNTSLFLLQALTCCVPQAQNRQPAIRAAVIRARRPAQTFARLLASLTAAMSGAGGMMCPAGT